jgi:hypothetical protein
MPLKIPDVGEVVMLDTLRSNWGTLQIGLYGAPHVPADADTLATYVALEMSFPGYARQDILNWIAPLGDGMGRALTVADVVTWTRGAGGVPASVHGYFVISPGGILLWAEQVPGGPFPINAQGNTYTILPAHTYRSQF